MKRSKRILLGITLVVASCVVPLHAQYEPDDESKINSNLGFTVGVPLVKTAQVVDTAWGITAGVGYNFNRRNAFVGELMWNRVYSTFSQLAPLRAAELKAAGFDGTTDLFVLTGNYRYELRGKTFGAYAIGGGGWYHRNTNLSRAVVSGTGTVCTPVWLWWGFSCTSGTVVTDQTIIDASASAWGANAGMGLTVRVGEAPYRLYFESRYHYAQHRDLNTQFMTVTFGVRY